MTKTDYPSGPTTKAKVNSREYDAELLGENKLGSVHLHGPYGNNNSKIKIACLIGMHPYESKSHRAFFETIQSKEIIKLQILHIQHQRNKGRYK